MPELKKLNQFFLMWDEEKPCTWQEMEPVLDALLHKDFKMSTPTDSLTKVCMMTALRNMLHAGEVLQLTRIEKAEYGEMMGIEYEYDVKRRCGRTIRLRAFAIFRDEKLYHVEALNPEEYDEVFTKSMKTNHTFVSVQ